MPQVTLHLTNEEQERIEEFSKTHDLNRHAIMKRAIRKMLGLKIKGLRQQLPNRS
jgi:predicted transcriptional regulator